MFPDVGQRLLGRAVKGEPCLGGQADGVTLDGEAAVAAYSAACRYVRHTSGIQMVLKAWAGLCDDRGVAASGCPADERSGTGIMLAQDNKEPLNRLRFVVKGVGRHG
jgi:hypothetical protein